MYCTNCGNKLKNNSNYCNKCGKKIIKNVNKNNDDYKVLCMIIGILSIIGSLVINIMICPLAIFGIIISIKYHQKQELILNIIACIIAIIIFTLIILFLFQIPNIAKKDYKETIPNYKYDDKYNNDDYNYNKELDINITGTWYLYKDNTLNNGTYYKFNSNKTVTYVTDNNTYTGTYSIDNNYNNNSYTLNINITSLYKSDGTITNNPEKNTYNINLNNDIIEMYNIKTNEHITLKKDISIIY